MKKILVGLLILCSPMAVLAQDFLGKVTLEELREEKDVLDPEANAAILQEEGKVYFDYIPSVGFKMNQVVTRKIKVYTKDGISFVDLSVPYYVGNGVNEYVKIDQVYTYNEKEGKIERTKPKSNAIFDDKKDDSWKVKKVIFPDVKEGSIVEYRYTVTSDYFNVIPAWYFQRSIPIRKSSYEVKIPGFLVYTTRFKGNVKIARENRSEKKKIRVTNAPPYEEVEMQESTQKYTVTDVLPIKSEPFIDTIENYRGSLQFDLSMVNYPNQKPKVISLSEEDLIKSIYESPSFKGQLEQTKYFEKHVNLDEFKALDDTEKAKRVLALVQNQVKWNEKNGYYTSDGVRKAWEQKLGNVAEINLMLTSMLRYVGLTANPILVSTVNNGSDISLQKTSFNRVLSSVEIDKAIYLLDGTNTYTNLNIVPISNLNWIGIIIDKNGAFGKVDMKPNFYSISSESFVLTWKEGDVQAGSGQALFSYTDYKAYRVRTSIEGESEEEVLHALEKTYDNMNIQGVRLYNREDTNKDMSLRFSFEKNAIATEVGEELYLNPLQFYDLKSNPWKAEERTMPISFQFPTIDLYKLTVKTPVGYEIEYIPQTTELSDKSVGLHAIYKVDQAADAIHVSLEFSKSKLSIEPADYQKVRGFYEKLITQLEEQIIFKKTAK